MFWFWEALKEFRGVTSPLGTTGPMNFANMSVDRSGGLILISNVQKVNTSSNLQMVDIGTYNTANGSSSLQTLLPIDWGRVSLADQLKGNELICSEGKWASQHGCTDCRVDFYCSNTELNACPPFSTTFGSTHATKITDCVCKFGYYKVQFNSAVRLSSLTLTLIGRFNPCQI